MEYKKIINLLSNISGNQLPKYVTKKWIEIYDESDGTYNVNKDVKLKTPQLGSDLCDWNDASIVVTGKIILTNSNNAAYDKKLTLKNNAPFFNSVVRINNILIDDCTDLDIVCNLFSLLYYSKNYQNASGSLFNYYRFEPSSCAENGFNYSIKNSKSFEYKTSLTGKFEGNNTELEDIRIPVPLRYLSTLNQSLDIPLINCEVSLSPKWSKNCLLTSRVTRPAGDNPATNPAVNVPTNAEFSITDCKLYVPVVTLSTEYENKLYQQLKEGFVVNIYWNKYRCQVTNQRAGLINYIIDIVFDNVSKLYVLAYENEEDRSSFSEYYTPIAEITDYNVLIDQQPFFELPIRNKKKTYEKIIEIRKVLNDYTAVNLLDCDYFLNHYKLNAIDLSKKIIELAKQQINFIGKLNQNATLFFIIEKLEQTA